MPAEGDDFRAGYYGEQFARFEEWGETSVRAMLSSGQIVPGDREAALVWLGDRDRLAISTQARALAAAEAEAAAAIEQAVAAVRQADAADKQAAAAVAEAEAAARLASSAPTANRLAIIAIVISAISAAAAVVSVMVHPR
jgi:hypothetical protein